MEKIISERTHYKCRVKIEQTLQDYYEFLVPQHLVGEDGMIDEKITDEITEKVDRTGIGFSDCEGNGELDDYSSLEVLEYELTTDYCDPNTNPELPLYDVKVSLNNQLV